MNADAPLKTADGHASGKVILLGEHAAVYGQPALAAPLPQGITATARPAEGDVSIFVPAWGLQVHSSDATPHGAAVRALCGALDLPSAGAHVVLTSQIPPRAGLGASAAMAGAVSRALSRLFSLNLDEDALFEAVQASERVFHKTPSGLDAAVSLSGQTLLFSKESGGEPIAAPLPQLMLVDSNIPKDTSRAVERFAERRRESPDEAEHKISRIGTLARLGADALKRGNTAALGALMTENHTHLRWFDVSCAALDRIVDIALRAGALGAKLTGGGRGGTAVVLPGDNPAAIAAALAESGFEKVPG